jgi:pilus assembly protein CpaB
MAKIQEKNTLPLIAGAIGFGIIAALLAMFYLNTREDQLRKQFVLETAEEVRVVVAKNNLSKGQEIRTDLFSIRAMPLNFVHGDAVTLNQFDQFIGRSLTTPIGKGKALLKSFVNENFPRDFSDIIPPGKRAINVEVDENNTIGGHLRPGNRIDLYVNIPFTESGFSASDITAAQDAGLFNLLPSSLRDQIPEQLMSAARAIEDPKVLLNMFTPEDVIIPVIQNVTVLATGRDTYEETLDSLRQPQRRSDSSFSNITILVDPQQAALVTMAQDRGAMVSLLRNRGDISESDFSVVGPSDLFDNAGRMAMEEKLRSSRLKLGDGVDVNCNVVDGDGNKVVDRDDIIAAGYNMNEFCLITDKDGNTINPSDIMYGPDGNVITKQQLAVAGFTINKSGQIIDKDGNLVDVKDIIVSADGKVMTKQQLAAAGLRVNVNGEIVDENGKVVNVDEIVVSEDGTVLTADQLLAAGLSINENGEIVNSDGEVVNPDELIISADGSVISSEALAAVGLSVNEFGQVVDKNGKVVDPDEIVIASDGSIMTKEQLATAGLSINENGEIIDADGNIVEASDLITSASGKVLSKKLLASSGYNINEEGEIVDASGNKLSENDISSMAEKQSIKGQKTTASGIYQVVVGGSKDGVSTTSNVTIPQDRPSETTIYVGGQ